MSLVGNLEDLGLGDILQIVSLSRKSGVLSLRNRGREGRIVFLRGQVIQATSSVSRDTLGDLLLRKGLVSPDSLRKALHQQRQTCPPVRLGTILCEQFGLSRQAVEAVLRQQVENIVYSFFGWTEGDFTFDLGEPEDFPATYFDPLQFMLDQGLNPQWLALEGGRLGDGRRDAGGGSSLDGVLPSADDRSPREEEYHSGLAPRGKVLLIDDNPLVGDHISRALRDRGLAVSTFSHPGNFLEAAQSEEHHEDPPVLLIDLVMPGEDGAGMLGGYELLEKVRCNQPKARVIIMTDLPSPEAERRIGKLGIMPVLTKPKPRDLSSGEGILALGALAETVRRFADDKDSRKPHFNLGAELSRELDEAPGDRVAVNAVASPGLHLLKGMLLELNNPSLGGGIILLVLRFASEFMNRAVIFSVKEKEIVGLGQFGIEVSEGNPDARVRSMRIPVEENSPFTTVLERGIPAKVRPEQGKWDMYLQEALGGGAPEEIFLGPLISEGKIVAILYGDNLPRKSSVGDTEPLEIFLSQAGMVMEKVLLERRLHEISIT